MRSSKHAPTESSKSTSKHLLTLHQRLHHALSLGTRIHNGKESKWQSADIEIQRHVVRSIASFLDCLSGDNRHNPLVKDSLADIVAALAWILKNRSKAVLGIATNVVVNLIKIVPNTMLQRYTLSLVHPLASLLPSVQVEVSISCATALNMIISNLSVKKENEVWAILFETQTVSCIISGITEFYDGAVPVEYFREMTSLLSAILYRWPPSRYPAWNDAKLLEVMQVIRGNPDFSVKVSVLNLYCALALCGNGAKKLLENGEALLHMMALCMGKSYPLSVRTAGFRLAQCFAINEQACLRMMTLCCEPIVNAIIDGMRGWTSNSGKIDNDEMSLLMEACHLAQMIIRWPGKHHNCFWKLEIDLVLLNILLDFHNGPSQHSLSLEDQITIVQEGLKVNFRLGLRPYVWDFLGWLSTHCQEDFSPNTLGREVKFDMLITCACISFLHLVQQGCQIWLHDVADTSGIESASRTILMMIYSPCKYISSKAKVMLSEVLKQTSTEYVKHLLHTLDIRPSKDNLGTPYLHRIGINSVALTCYSILQQYQCHIIKSGGIKTLFGLVKWCLSNDIHIERSSLVPRLHNRFTKRTCCWECYEDWEGNSILLFYGMWGLAELIHSRFVSNSAEIFSDQVDFTEPEFVSALQKLCSDSTSSGIKWCASLILSYFGLYGFPCKLGKRIGKALDEKEYSDIQLILTNRDPMSVHGILLAARCPSLLPPEEFPFCKKELDGSSMGFDFGRESEVFQKEIRLSSHVDNQALAKLLEFVYLGFLNAGDELVKKVKILAKRCRVQPLLVILNKRHPKWGTLFPKYDLSLAPVPAWHYFSDLILESKPSESVAQACSMCSRLLPHMHVHRVVLSSSCDYLRALFRSGMVESNSQIIKVPVSWDAMVKLVMWFYSDELPIPPSGCLWDNMGTEEKLAVLQPYMELCWLAGFWFLEYVQDVSCRVILSCLDSARHLSIRIIKIAADLSIWKLVEVAANYLAPQYRQLCQSGDLEGLDEGIVDMIRAASVQLSQEGG